MHMGTVMLKQEGDECENEETVTCSFLQIPSSLKNVREGIRWSSLPRLVRVRTGSGVGANPRLTTAENELCRESEQWPDIRWTLWLELRGPNQENSLISMWLALLEQKKELLIQNHNLSEVMRGATCWQPSPLNSQSLQTHEISQRCSDVRSETRPFNMCSQDVNLTVEVAVFSASSRVSLNCGAGGRSAFLVGPWTDYSWWEQLWARIVFGSFTCFSCLWKLQQRDCCGLLGKSLTAHSKAHHSSQTDQTHSNCEGNLWSSSLKLWAQQSWFLSCSSSGRSVSRECGDLIACSFWEIDAIKHIWVVGG